MRHLNLQLHILRNFQRSLNGYRLNILLAYTETFELGTNESLPRYHGSHQKVTLCLSYEILSRNNIFQLAQTLWPSVYPQFSQKTGLEVQKIYLAHRLKLWGNYVQLKFWDNWNIFFHCTTTCTQNIMVRWDNWISNMINWDIWVVTSYPEKFSKKFK